MAKTTSSTGYEPNVIDNSDYSETFSAIFQNESFDIATEPPCSFDAELDDELHRKALSSPLFTQEREELANLRQTYHSQEESLLPAHTSKNGKSRVRTKFKCLRNGNQVATWRTSKAGFSLKDKKEQILAEVKSEIQKHELQAESDRRSIQESTGTDGCQRMEVDHTITRCEQSRRDQLLLQEEISEQNRDLRETCIRKMRDMEQIAEKSHVKGRRTFKKQIDWRLWGSIFILPGLECQDSPQPWRQRREVPRCWDWRRAHQEFTGFTTVPSGARSKCEPLQVYHSQRESLFQRAQSIFSKHGETRHWMSQEANPTTKSWTTDRSGSFLERQGNNCSQKQNPRSWDMNTERILPKIIFANWRDKLILKQWKLGILEQGMNSPDENKLYFTKNWQIENEHFVILVFKSWKNWREIRNFASRNFRERRKVENLFTDVESVHSDNYFAFPVNQRYFFFLVNQEDCWAATKICSQIYGIRMIYQETFLDGLHASTSTTYSGMLNSRDFSVTWNIPMQARTNLEPKWLKSQKAWRDHRLEF